MPEDTPPNPARDAEREPRLDAEDLEKEIGDSEVWDQASPCNREDDQDSNQS